MRHCSQEIVFVNKTEERVLDVKTKSPQSEEQTSHQQKSHHWQGGSKVTVFHIHHSFPCSPVRRTDTRPVFHTYAKRGKTDRGQ